MKELLVKVLGRIFSGKRNKIKDLKTLRVNTVIYVDERDPLELASVTCMNFACPCHPPDGAYCNCKSIFIDGQGKCTTGTGEIPRQ